ncbi:unnamed protein product, partial [Cladocopium goreaui]
VTSLWPVELMAALGALARQHQASEMALLLSLFGLLLSRNFDQDDLLVGIPEAGRSGDLSVLQNIMGFFVNTLPIRLSFQHKAPTFGELLKRTQQTLFEAIDHSAIPFQHLVNEMRQHQEVDGNQLLQAFFQHVVAGQSHSPRKAAGMVLEHFDFEPHPAPAKFEA